MNKYKKYIVREPVRNIKIIEKFLNNNIGLNDVSLNMVSNEGNLYIEVKELKHLNEIGLEHLGHAITELRQEGYNVRLIKKKR